MARTIDLSAEVNKILQEYGDDVYTSINQITREVAQKGVRKLKADARNSFGGTGEYAKEWTSQVETGHVSAQGVIYNKDLPGLPHLLEHGHAMRNGGRAPGKVHIKPVEDELVRSFEQAIRRDL